MFKSKAVGTRPEESLHRLKVMEAMQASMARDAEVYRRLAR